MTHYSSILVNMTTLQQVRCQIKFQLCSIQDDLSLNLTELGLILIFINITNLHKKLSLALYNKKKSWHTLFFSSAISILLQDLCYTMNKIRIQIKISLICICKTILQHHHYINSLPTSYIIMMEMPYQIFNQEFAHQNVRDARKYVRVQFSDNSNTL